MTWDKPADALLVDAATECGLGNWPLVAALMGEGFHERVVSQRFMTLIGPRLVPKQGDEGKAEANPTDLQITVQAF